MIPRVMPLVASVLAQTTDTIEIAKAHYKAGSGYFERGEFALALAEFEKADDLSRKPGFQYNIAVCHEKLGKGRKAIVAYQSYLDRKPNASDRKEVESRINLLLGEQTQQQKETAPPPRSVASSQLANKLRTSTSNTSEPRRLSSLGKNQPKPSQGVKPISSGKTVDPFATKTKATISDTYVPPNLKDNTDIGLTKSRSDSIPYRNLMWTSFALSTASLMTGVIAHFAATGKEEDYSNKVDELEANGQLGRDSNNNPYLTRTMSENENRSQLNTLKDEVTTRGDIAIAGFVGAGGFLGLGALFYILRSDQVTMTAGVQANGGHVNMQVRF